MTWTGQFTVQDVSNEEAPGRWLVRATAETGEKVRPYAAQGDDREVDALNSNTEGKLRSVEVLLVLEEDAAPLAVGDVIQVHGHFTKRTPTEA